MIIATPKTNNHNYFKSHFNKENIFYGSEKDVLERYYKCAKKFDSDIIIRITSDCPLMDYRIIDNMLEKFNKNNFDYLRMFIHLLIQQDLTLKYLRLRNLKKRSIRQKKNFKENM